MMSNRWKCTNHKQLSTKQPSRWTQKGNRIRKNNNSLTGTISMALYIITHVELAERKKQIETC